MRSRLQDGIRCAKHVLGRMPLGDKEGGSWRRLGRRGVTSKGKKYSLWKPGGRGEKKEGSVERASDQSTVSRKVSQANEAFLHQNHPLEMVHVFPKWAWFSSTANVRPWLEGAWRQCGHIETECGWKEQCCGRQSVTCSMSEELSCVFPWLPHLNHKCLLGAISSFMIQWCQWREFCVKHRIYTENI